MNREDAKDARAVREAADKAGMTLTNAVIGSPDGGIGGGLTDPSKRSQWLARVEQTLAFCRDANVGAAIVCTGNVIPGRTSKQMRSSVIDGLKATLPLAERYGVDLLLETLNDKIDHANYFLTSSDESADLCRQIGSPRLKLLFDCYHMQIMEGDLCGHIKKNIDVIGHFHSAGHPGRHELWLGETNYPFLVQQIGKLGYEKVFALEFSPTLVPAESLRKTLSHLRS
jgi:hydroxypyruvate isomerase